MRSAALALCLLLCGTARGADAVWAYPDPDGRYRITLPLGWAVMRVNSARLEIRWQDTPVTHEACNIVVADDAFTRGYSQAEIDTVVREGALASYPMKSIVGHPEAKLKKSEIVKVQGRLAQVAEVAITLHLDHKDIAAEEYTYFIITPGRTYEEYCDVYADHFARLKSILDSTMRSIEITAQ